jgi:hypothetical protein
LSRQSRDDGRDGHMRKEGLLLNKEDQHPAKPEEPESGEGHPLLDIGKFVFLVVALTAFWYFFDTWLAGN